MSWAEIKKAINSNISKSLDVLITEKSNEVKTAVTDNKSLLNNSTYGLSALNTLITNTKNLLENTTYGLNAIKNTVNSVNDKVSGNGNIKCVKSVQRGTINCGTNATGIIPGAKFFQSQVSGQFYGTAYISIDINKVDINKSILLFSENIEYEVYEIVDVNNKSRINLYFVSASDSNLNGYATRKVYKWQVIEFY